MSLEDLQKNLREQFVALDSLRERAGEHDVPVLVEEHLEVAQRHVDGAKEAVDRELEDQELATDGGQQLAVRECPFPDCDWTDEYNPEVEYNVWESEERAALHYEEEHVGRLRVRLVFVGERMYREEDPKDVRSALLEKYRDEVPGFGLGHVVSEVLQEPDDHSVLDDEPVLVTDGGQEPGVVTTCLVVVGPEHDLRLDPAHRGPPLDSTDLRVHGFGWLKDDAFDEVRERVDFDAHAPGTEIATVTLDCAAWDYAIDYHVDVPPRGLRERLGRLLTDGGVDRGHRDLGSLLDELPEDPKEIASLAEDDPRITEHGGVVVVHPYRNDAGRELVTDGGPEPVDAGYAEKADVEVPEWAEDLEVGDWVAYDSTVAGVLEAEVLGFSTRHDYAGLPVVDFPEEVIEHKGRENFRVIPDQLVLREEDLVEVGGEELATDGGAEEAVLQIEEEHAPNCGDCGTRTDLRGLQEPGRGDRWLLQWICPKCEPERVKITRGLPDGYEVIPTEPEDDEQQTLTQVATDGGTEGAGRERRIKRRQPTRGYFCAGCAESKREWLEAQLRQPNGGVRSATFCPDCGRLQVSTLLADERVSEGRVIPWEEAFEQRHPTYLAERYLHTDSSREDGKP